MAQLTPQERAAAISELEASRQRLRDAIDGVTEEEWRRHPGADRWSIAECVEHIGAAELPLERLFATGAREQPTQEERDRIRGNDDYVRNFLRDRSQKGEAPERIRPRGRFSTREEAVATFEERRAANIAWVRATTENLRERFGQHPFAGVIDGYQWLLFLSAHCDRHAAQIEEIRAELSPASS